MTIVAGRLSEQMITGLGLGSKAIMAGLTCGGYIRMIELGYIPGIGVMAFITALAGLDMVNRFTGCSEVIMANVTLLGNERMIKSDRLPGRH